MRRELSVDVAKLLAANESAGLGLSVLSDWGGLERTLTRPRIQKPGLALSGFVKHVYADRLQVLGLTEIDFLLSSPPEEVDAAYAHALACGATAVKKPEKVFWGGYSGYFADLDGHLWELAHNPFMPLSADRHMTLPQ